MGVQLAEENRKMLYVCQRVFYKTPQVQGVPGWCSIFRCGHLSLAALKCGLHLQDQLPRNFSGWYLENLLAYPGCVSLASSSLWLRLPGQCRYGPDPLVDDVYFHLPLSTLSGGRLPSTSLIPFSHLPIPVSRKEQVPG